jgi:hypothetical protein
MPHGWKRGIFNPKVASFYRSWLGRERIIGVQKAKEQIINRKGNHQSQKVRTEKIPEIQPLQELHGNLVHQNPWLRQTQQVLHLPTSMHVQRRTCH